jgi:hypothetical protein
MIRYSQMISWAGNEVEVSGDTLTEVQEAAVKLAKESGWTPRHWWQFWRWSEPDYSKLEQFY